MVRVAAGKRGDVWFGVAWEGENLVATAVGSTRDSALLSVRGCVPGRVLTGVFAAIAEEPPGGLAGDDAAFVESVVEMLGELEQGDESHKRFALSPVLSEPLRRILTAAAAVPLGYVTTYGDVARAAGSEARAVGRVMATNPLYPIVPCHRVVGTDMALVGYGGKQDEAALAAKLARLRAESRGSAGRRNIDLSAAGQSVAGLSPEAPPLRALAVYPVEQVIEAAPAHEERRRRAAQGEAGRARAERQQLRLL